MNDLIKFVLVLAIVPLIATLLVKFLWWFVIADIFAGAIEQGLIPLSLSWWQAFKLAVFGTGLGGASRSSS